MTAGFYIDLHPDVEADYADAYDWYELQQKGLGERLLLGVREKLASIKLSPETFGVKSRNGYREAKVDDFPYVIVYKVYPARKRIFVTAIHHEKKNENKKYRK